MGLIKRHAVSAAVVCLLVAAGLWLFYPGVPARWVFLAAGVAFLLLSLILNAREAQTAMGTRTVRYGTGAAVAHTVALLVAGMADNILKPLMLGRGVDVPMPVILLGALGGMASAGILGMFVGATLLALGYQIFTTWVATNPD